jgi:mRNA interferase MazF
MNDHLKTVIIAPLTSTLKPLPSRIGVYIDGQHGMIALDHIRSVSKNRLGNYIDKLNPDEIRLIKHAIQKMLVD